VFTGIISDIGEIIGWQDEGDRRSEIATKYDLNTIDLGACIASSGVCLTVIEMGTRDDVNFYDVEALKETLDLTTAGQWQLGTKLNLERALRLGDELGGHLVSGHVDGIARIISIRPEGASNGRF